MKKTLVILLTLCMCLTLCVSLTACNSEPEHTHSYTEMVATEDFIKSEATCMKKAVYHFSCKCGEKGTETFESGNLAEHDYSTAWTKGDGKHWHACQTDGCTAKSNKETHIYNSGSCVCGELEPVVDINEVTQAQWESAFEFENVTINQYAEMQGQNILVVTYFIDGNDAAMSAEGSIIPLEGYADYARLNYDFTNLFNSAQYQEGKYIIDSFDVHGDGRYIYENAYLTFENGILKSIDTTIKQVIPEYDDDYNEIGSTIETFSSFIEFVDYGETEVLKNTTLPISKAEWDSVFDTENLNNMTIVASFSIEDTAYVENIYYDNGIEKITVDVLNNNQLNEALNNVELYCVNSTWYAYNVSENSFVETDVYGPAYPYITYSDAFKNLFSAMKDLYGMISYDTIEDRYYYTFDNSSCYITFDNGKVTTLTYISITEGQTNVFSYTISNYGTTSFVVPFNPNVD